MCFSKAFYAKAKKTTEDIVCFKILLKKGTKLYSPIQKWSKWEKDVVVEADEFKTSIQGCNVHNGLHSFKSLQAAILYKKYMPEENKVFIARIPAGSKVYINDEQYCSDKLIIENAKPLT